MINTQYQYQYCQEANFSTQYQYQYYWKAKVNTQYQYWAQSQYLNTYTRYCRPLIANTYMLKVNMWLCDIFVLNYLVHSDQYILHSYVVINCFELAFHGDGANLIVPRQ